MSRVNFPRAAGILLHPTSLPGRFGIGDLGPEAHRWIDTLASARQSVWQVLPLGPTGFGDSPYQCFSAMAGNPYLVSYERLRDDDLLTDADLASAPRLSDSAVEFGPVIESRERMLERAHERFRTSPRDANPVECDEYERFCQEHAAWLDDYALFRALKSQHGGRPWPEWSPELARREPDAIASARVRLERAVDAHRFQQWIFFKQWRALRDRARGKGIRIIGDVPIFVAHDSADTWAHPELFLLDDRGHPTAVAGVPPDYFAKTGQLWGNPLYRWEAHAHTGFAWWTERMRGALELVDVVRLDHFRGFEAHWQVPSDHPTAEHGEWVKGPGRVLFDAIRGALGALPVIAEDLGVITPEVRALRDELGLPGMKVLQFAFGSGSDNSFLPHNHERNAVVYTGTHDNDPTRSWFEHAPAHERDRVMRYLDCDERRVTWSMIRAAQASVAHTAVIPMQDVMELGREGRMNLPGRPEGNWGWRFRWEDIEPWRWEMLKNCAELYGRAPV